MTAVRPDERSNSRAVTFGVMARAPVPGRCKTRLAQTVGSERAAAIYAAMLADRIDAIEALPATRRVVLAAPEDDGVAALARLVHPGWEVIAQEGPGLGERLAHAFETLCTGEGVACVVDSDSPSLSLASSFSAIQAVHDSHEDVLLGPCEDGGYYLIGMTTAHARLFENIPWSTAQVLGCTRDRASELSLSVRELELGWDVDTADDLARLAELLRRSPERAPRTAAALVTHGLLGLGPEAP